MWYGHSCSRCHNARGLHDAAANQPCPSRGLQEKGLPCLQCCIRCNKRCNNAFQCCCNGAFQCCIRCNKLVTYHSWFACPLLDLQADSHTRVGNGGAPLMPPRYLQLDLPKHVLRNVSRFRLQAPTFAVKSSIWRGGDGRCDKCSRAAVQNEVHVLFHCQDLFVCSLRRKPVIFYGSPLCSTSHA